MFKEFLVSFISKFYLKGGWGNTTPKCVVFFALFDSLYHQGHDSWAHYRTDMKLNIIPSFKNKNKSFGKLPSSMCFHGNKRYTVPKCMF